MEQAFGSFKKQRNREIEFKTKELRVALGPTAGSIRERKEQASLVLAYKEFFDANDHSGFARNRES